jgi:hypothetical protein
MDSLLISLLSQLAGQAPTLLVYFGGMIVALVFLRRYPGPAALTLLAAGLLLVTAVVQSCLSIYLVRAREDLGWTVAQFGGIMSATALVGNAIRAVAFALLLTAVFVGRRVGGRRGPGEELERAGPA